ncbi:MAG: NAD(P)H-dependent oxidoreductase, partial [Campylobacter sp.]|nr:NAD(P)H-dependent oxidoreductase [Campylobacter sp.]
MKTLIILAHPDIKNSRINKALKTVALESGVSISELYEKYPNFNIDIKKEQELLVAHDRIILQFPCFWYSSPPLLKKYFDDIFT